MEKGFVYDRENHIGYFNGKVIPSITQLLAIKYPLVGVSQELLDKASAYGTNVHTDCEMVANGLCEPNTLEGLNFQNIFATLGFVSVVTEKQVLFFNDLQEVIAYGTYDGIYQATKNIYFDPKEKSICCKDQPNENDILLFKENELVIYDIKTTSTFDTEKVSLQTSLYALAEENIVVDKAVGLWLRETKAQIKFLNLDREYAQITLNELLESWKERNESI